MALNQFPYTNFHELNGDYVLQTVQQSAADAQAAQQSAQAAQQAAQTAAGQVTEANVKAAAALIAANEAKTDATTANTKSNQALSQAQTATDAATAAAASAQTAQQAASAAQTSASAADQSAQQAASDAERAITLAQQALDTIPTADTMAWDPSPNNAYYIGTTPGYVGTALDIAYPKYIEFNRVGTTNQYQATVTEPLNSMVPALQRGLNIDAIIYRGPTLEIQQRLKLTDLWVDNTTVHMAWMGVISDGGTATIIDVLVMEAPRNASTLTAVLHSYNLSPLEV